MEPKAARLKKKFATKMAAAGFKGSKAKNSDVGKNNINVLSLYRH